MKTCNKCKEAKPLSQFNKNPTKKDGRGGSCKECVRAFNRDYYAQNRESQIERVARRKRVVAKDNVKKIRAYLTTHPCVDCGESDTDMLEFDHVRGTKDNAVSKLAYDGFSWDRIQKEIAKCEVRCANHHRKRHALQRLE